MEQLQVLANSLLWQLGMITFFFVGGLIATVLDMLAGAYVNRAEFSITKFFSGLKWVVILYVVIVGIVELVTVFLFGIEFFDLVYVNNTLFENLSASFTAVTILIFGLQKIKDAVNKLRNEYGFKPIETEVNTQAMYEDGEG